MWLTTETATEKFRSLDILRIAPYFLKQEQKRADICQNRLTSFMAIAAMSTERLISTVVSLGIHKGPILLLPPSLLQTPMLLL